MSANRLITMLLFLDFDGVLHPEDTVNNPFCCLPLLHEILRGATGVDVVFTTSWRRLMPVKDLAQLVTQGAPELQSRMIGHTPHLETEQRPQGVIGQRQDEIQLWLAQNGQKNRPWLALDDCQHFFWPDCANLYLVDWKTGLVPDDVEGVRNLMESLR